MHVRASLPRFDCGPCHRRGRGGTEDAAHEGAFAAAADAGDDGETAEGKAHIDLAQVVGGRALEYPASRSSFFEGRARRSPRRRMLQRRAQELAGD